MKIAEEAREIILKAMETNKADCLLVSQQETCCGKSLSFSLANLKEGEEANIIDGVPVYMDVEIEELVGMVSILAENGQLFVHDENAKECDC